MLVRPLVYLLLLKDYYRAFIYALIIQPTLIEKKKVNTNDNLV